MFTIIITKESLESHHHRHHCINDSELFDIFIGLEYYCTDRNSQIHSSKR